METIWILIPRWIRSATDLDAKAAVTVLDRYGHVFPSTEQRLNDRLDALYSSAVDEAATKGQVINLGR